MRIKGLLLLGLVAIALFTAAAMTADHRQSLTPLPAAEQRLLTFPEARVACPLSKTSTMPSSYFSSYQTGVGSSTYFNPALMCPTPTYPFAINSFSFVLYDPGGYTWPASVSVVVYAMGTDSCAGPGTELCRYPVVADQATFGYPNLGTFTFPTPCCVNGPFFIGLEYTAGAAGTAPSILFDNNAAPVACDNWMHWVDGLYHEWYSFWTPPVAGYPIFLVNGETQSTLCKVCNWQPGDPAKMHFPQLPDEIGWDVNATAPVVLADDWRCSQTGWVKDVHFWGSWRNGIVGQISYFVLSIHADIPADPTQNMYSHPGATLWEKEVASFQATPVDPATMEGWYDPSSGEVIYNDHGSYFQYNICLDSLDWFHQVQGTIYWLNISAVLVDPQTTRWGWKSSTNHFNDDAVWALWSQLNWIDMFEPGTPTANPFFVQIDVAGNLTGGGGGFYGLGWYFYPSEWWNIWFYDHPFSQEREKLMVLDFDLFKIDPQFPSFIELAFNWSTDRWSMSQPPGDSMPPLPGVFPESLYIGRKTVLIGPDLQGHFHFDYPFRNYNPEWVSVDVRGTNFVIPQGTLVHECRQSLDLSFVITNGDTAIVCDCMPGDADGSGGIDISDAVWLISYIFGGGPNPTPYPVCSGDADCSCGVDISDAVWLIAYIFGGGPAPCDCLNWLAICGPPLR